MKVEFKIGDLVKSIEGTEQEIISIATAMGLLKPRPSNAYGEDDSAKLAEKMLLGWGYEYAATSWRPAQWLRKYNFHRYPRYGIGARANAAMVTLEHLGYTYDRGCELWRQPPAQCVHDSSAWTGRNS